MPFEYGLASASFRQASFAAVQSRTTANRLLTYRWYPTTVSNWDGRLIVGSGLDLDQGTGCERNFVRK